MSDAAAPGLSVRLADLVGRRIRTERRVEYLDCDGYLHLGSADFLRFAIDHRFTATHDALGLNSFERPEETGLAWPIVRSEMDFLAEAKLGDWLVIESWIDERHNSRAVVRLRISQRDSGRECCRVALTIIALDVATRRAVPLPDSLPVHRRVDLDALPWAEGHPRTS